MDIRKFVVGQFLLFFIWPFGSFVTSVATLNLYKSSRIIFVLFAMLYGYTFVFDQSEFGSDNGRVKEEFFLVSKMDIKGFTEFIALESTTDVFLPVSYYLVSKVSNDAHVLYGFFALIYSFFFILSFMIVFRIIDGKKLNYSLIILLFLFLLYIRFSAINGVRFWIACFIYIYSVLKIVIYSKYNYLILLFTTPFIHFSYFLGVLIILTYLLIGRKLVYCYVLFGISVVFPVEFLNSMMQSTGYFTFKVNDYFRENNVISEKEKRENTNFYIEWGAIIAQKFMTFALFAPAILKSNYKFDNIESRLYSFLIVYISFLNFTSGSFEVYRRFFEVFIMICIVFFIKVISNEKITYKSPKFIQVFSTMTLFALLPKILLGLRSGIETLNSNLIYRSVFQLIDCGNTSVYDFLHHNNFI